jgi:hypothetical protein
MPPTAVAAWVQIACRESEQCRAAPTTCPHTEADRPAHPAKNEKTDLETAKKVLDSVKADKNPYWWNQVLKSKVTTVVRKFTDFKVTYNALKPKTPAKKDAAESLDSSLQSCQRLRMRASRLTGEVQDAIKAASPEALKLAEAARAKAVEAHSFAAKLAADHSTFLTGQALESAEKILKEAHAAYEAAIAAAKAA